MQYGRAIKLARTARGFSQRKLAEAVVLDPSYISRIEAGARVPTLESLETISGALRVPLHLLVLLASEDEALRGVTSDQASRLGTELLNLLVGTSAQPT